MEGNRTFAFPNYPLRPGDGVEVHGGTVAPPSGGSTLRWTTSYIWHDGGDEARLRDPCGGTVDSDEFEPAYLANPR